MEQLSDNLLLRRYCENQDDRAFSRIVERNLPMVFAVACRVTGRRDLAEDVSQQVFIKLARNPEKVRVREGLLPWLHCAARTHAIDALRTESRRRARESQAAELMNPHPTDDLSWGSLAPHLDQIVHELALADRQVIILRYYQGYNLQSLAEVLGVSPEAARKRAVRALDRLRAGFVKRGIGTSSAALAAMLPVHALSLPPSGLAAAVTSTALASVSTAIPASSLLALIFMKTTTKVAIGAVCTAAILGSTLLIRSKAGSSSENDPPSPAALSPRNRTGKARASTSPDNAEESKSGSRQSDSGKFTDNIARLESILVAGDAPALDKFISSLDSEESRRALDYIQSLGKKYQADELIGLALQRWGEWDPARAATWAVKNDSSGEQASQILSLWTEKDPQAVSAWVNAVGEKGYPHYTRIIQWLPQDPEFTEQADRMIALLPPGDQKDQATMANLYRQKGVEGTIQSIQEMPQDQRISALSSMPFEVTRMAPTETLDIMRSSGFFAGDEDSKIYHALKSVMNSPQEQELFDYVANLPPGEEKDRFEKQLAKVREDN